jgi:uncharacterized membrane protein YbhN (UPF0104 family)
LSFFTFVIAGYQFAFMIKIKNNIKIKMQDIILLPISANLFSYIIPTNGSIIFTSFFLKNKYNLNLSSGFSYGVFMVYVSLILTGLMGLFSQFFLTFNLFVVGVSIMLILFPAFIYLLNIIIQQFSFKENTILYRIQMFVNSVIANSNILFISKRIIVFIILSTLLLQLLALGDYYFIFKTLGVKIGLEPLLLFFMFSRVSSMLKFLPGNLGLDEFYTAGIFKIISKDPAFGVLLSLVNRFAVLVIVIPFGILHSTINLKYLNFKKQIISN